MAKSPSPYTLGELREAMRLMEFLPDDVPVIAQGATVCNIGFVAPETDTVYGVMGDVTKGVARVVIATDD